MGRVSEASSRVGASGKFLGPLPLHLGHRMYPEVFSELPDLHSVHLMVTKLARFFLFVSLVTDALGFCFVVTLGSPVRFRFVVVATIGVSKSNYRFISYKIVYYPVIRMIGDENNTPLQRNPIMN